LLIDDTGDSIGDGDLFFFAAALPPLLLFLLLPDMKLRV
jgi:hypothetical protein